MVTGTHGSHCRGLITGYDSKDLAELGTGMHWLGCSQNLRQTKMSPGPAHNRALYAARIPASERLALGAGLLDGNVALAQLDRLTIGVPQIPILIGLTEIPAQLHPTLSTGNR